METKIFHKGIQLELLMNEKPTLVLGRGWVHPAKIIGKATRDDLDKLIGITLWSEKIKAVESFAVYDQSSKTVGLLLEKPMWGKVG